MNTTALQFFPTTTTPTCVDTHNNGENQFPDLYNFTTEDSSPEILIPIDQDSSASDCESGVAGSSSLTSSSGHRRRHRNGIFHGVANELTDGERAYQVIKQRFLAGVGEKTVNVVAIHRKNWSELPCQARAQAFQVYSRALESKNSGSPNIKFGWYGGDKDRIEHILAHGFSFLDLQNHDGAIFLSPDHSPALSMDDSGADEDGLRHVLLCRVLLGRSELVLPGSSQTYPSSTQFDSGVDSLDNPSKYMIWSTSMNTHILPEYIVTFQVIKSSSKGVVSKMRFPQSPWISFPALLSVLAKFMGKNDISLLNTYHASYKDGKISRPELIQKVRQIAGDKLLISVIKSCIGRKELGMPSTFSKSRNHTKK